MKNMNLREMANCETNEMSLPALATKNESAHHLAARTRWESIFGGVMQTVQLVAWIVVFQIAQRQVCFAGAPSPSRR